MTADIDPTTPEFLRDPYPYLAAARDHAPIQVHPRGVYMVVLRGNLPYTATGKLLHRELARELAGRARPA
ncbi:hypothetical protein EAS64_25350 [Trebonia kvetii]|uniref:Uncharacterized protein n=1 Tax=Trebonia kvetii TaxID=2480626 RepID=A0A6P2BSX0_9ACTN|nr:hypothetical protein [Trebonia kvetii]TVZ02162.1 hypothetical protein EAS64_25350 [Trebonia kvetii]